MQGAWVPEDTVVLLLNYLSSGFMLHERKLNLYFCLSYSSLGPLLSAAKHREDISDWENSESKNLEVWKYSKVSE